MIETLAALVPARGQVDLLRRCLASLTMASLTLGRPCAVRVCVNGWPLADYQPLFQEFPEVEWLHHPRPLGFHGAIERLLAASSEDWLLLLNSDMRLDSQALVELWRCREAEVFALACQIEFADPQRRREETGWTVPVAGPDGQLDLHDLLPPDLSRRGACYAGGGASLFQASELRAVLPLSHAFRPFYFEDADWAIQAWARGKRVLFCPQARAVHEHRATIGHFHSASYVDRIITRNLSHLRFRYGDLFGYPRHASRSALLRRLLSPEHRRARSLLINHPQRAALPWQCHQRQPHPRRWRTGRLRVLQVSPFAVLPPGHGGARRIVELARASVDRLDVLLLHDEAPSTPVVARPDDALFRAIHPIGGRPGDDTGLDSRWRAHAHPAFLAELQRLLDHGGFDVVAFEHIECIGLIEALSTVSPLVWTLHDAGRELPGAATERVQRALARVSTLVLTTPADIGHWQHPRQHCIPNGVRLPDHFAPSTDPDVQGGRLLLVAPLRYRPNLLGLEQLLTEAWPQLRQQRPALELRVLGGERGREIWGHQALPAGVELVDGVVDPAPHYAWCSLVLNPQGLIEGSAIKLAEALAHGRIIVSTESGARGLEGLHSVALQRVADLRALAASVGELLDQPERRRAAEARARADVSALDWRLGAWDWIDLLQEASR